MKRKKTKIICTLGPASEKVETIKSLVEAGMDCVRLNFSHGSYDIHSGYINNIRQAAKEKNVLLPILQDISGPKIRVGLLENQKINLEEGGFISITNKEITGNEKVIFTSQVNYSTLVCQNMCTKTKRKAPSTAHSTYGKKNIGR